MLDSCSEPLVCTQETAAYFKEMQSLSFEMRPSYHHNGITVLIIGNPNDVVVLKAATVRNVAGLHDFIWAHRDFSG